jgi:uncharacterized membrane protein YhaH (DUF805 family)
MNEEAFREHYRCLTDDELAQILADKQDLVPEAVTALDCEVQRRHLAPPESPRWTRQAEGAEGAKLSRGIGWWVLGWKRCVQFGGRSSRREYWTFNLVNFLLLACVAFASPTIDTFRVGICLLLYAIPSLAVGVRRLHDLNKSGWWMLLFLFPFGGLVLFVFMLLKGDTGPNRYGDNPRVATLTQVIAS